MLNIAYAHASVVLVFFFHYHMLENKQSNRHSLHSMTSVVVLFAYPIKLIISTRNVVAKIPPKKNIVILYDFPNTSNKMLDKISLHKHF